MSVTTGSDKKPIPAATVILVRDDEKGLQVYLIRRSGKSSFMAGNFVYPGGKVDTVDRRASAWKDHVDLDSRSIADHLGGGLDHELALAYGVAAIRETIEEAGVFFGTGEGGCFPDMSRIHSLRATGALHPEWMLELAVEKGLTLSLSSLLKWSHWVTPELLKRRYDTRFFIACMPKGQSCVPDRRETTSGMWIRPKQGLEGNMEGKIPLSPPTLITLHDLLEYPRVQDLLTAARAREWGQPILPRLVPLERGAVILEPWDKSYEQPDIGLTTSSLSGAVLPVGEPFSRIWQDNEIWKPVAAG